ncbi:MAG: hypothetical protein M1816_001669 [Peltula sp. TS41687]|nr:MAG: hypothetical protein M1816_001669 [Peltula sp. TS41687]
MEVELTGGRPWVAQNPAAPRFQVNDTVYLSTAGSGARDGPYLIAKVHTESTPAKYTLSLPDGSQVSGGNEVEESCLSAQS